VSYEARAVRPAGRRKGEKKANGTVRATEAHPEHFCFQCLTVVQTSHHPVRSRRLVPGRNGDCNLVKRLAPQAGLEPATLRLTAGSSSFCWVLPDVAVGCWKEPIFNGVNKLSLAGMRRVLLGVAASCGAQKARKRQCDCRRVGDRYSALSRHDLPRGRGTHIRRSPTNPVRFSPFRCAWSKTICHWSSFDTP
jgi:hypothetical protein